jgi:hypothetical protein
MGPGRLTMLRVMTAAALLLTAVPAMAQDGPGIVQFESGNKLLEHCTQSVDFCSGYIAGIADAIRAQEVSALWSACIPAPVFTNQTKDIVIRYLKRHPETRHGSGANLASAALAEAFPCKIATKG